MVQADANALLPERDLEHYTGLRRALHRIPELGYEEFKTAELIRTELRRLDVPFVTGPAEGPPELLAPTATVAWIGDDRLPCVALRADIDALPITEQTGAPYSSTHEGRMHACGHDGHTANLLATASVLRRMSAELGVCVKLIWQPAEEGGGGADRLVRAGVLDGTGKLGPKVSAIFGLHADPWSPVGTVCTRPGPMLAATDTIRITVRGRGCHGAFPHFGRDPIVAASEIVTSLQSIVSREFDPVEPAVVTIGKFHAGTATNVIPDVAVIEGTVRTLRPETRDSIRRAIERRCTGIAMACDCAAEVVYQHGYPPTVNDPAMADLVARVTRERLGATRFIPAQSPVMGGEDFAYYLEKAPGAFFFVGVMPPGMTTYPPLHSDRFDFNDQTIRVGVEMFISLVRAWAQKNQ